MTESALVDELIYTQDQVNALVQLHRLYERAVPLRENASTLLENVAGAVKADAAGLEYDLLFGDSTLRLTRTSAGVSEDEYFKQNGIYPIAFREQIEENGFYEKRLGETYLLIVPVRQFTKGDIFVAGYLGLQRATEFDRNEIDIAGIFADTLPRLEILLGS